MERRNLSRSKKVIVFFLVFGIIGFGGWLYEEGVIERLVNYLSEMKKTSTSTRCTVERELISVTVKGEVNEPDIYRVPPGITLKKLIRKAGGFTDRADHEQLNLNFKIEQNLLIIIPPSRGILERLGVGRAPEETYINPPLEIKEE